MYIFLTDMKTSRLFHFVSSTNIGQILKLLNKVDFFSVTIFQQYYLSLQYLLQYQSFKESCVQGLTGQKKMSFWSKSTYHSFSENMVLFTQYLLYISKTYVAKISSMFLQDRELGCRKGFLNKKGIQRHQYVCLCCLQK